MVQGHQQKMVMKLTMANAKKRAKALQAAVSVDGVVSAALEDDKLVVVGTVDSVTLTIVLRKKMGHVELLSVAEAKKEEKKEDDKGAAAAWFNHGYYSMAPYQVVYLPEDTYSRGSGCIIL